MSGVSVGLYNISKSFPGVRALDNVTVEAYRGEVHAILGENGAGKTTLMNILYGLLKPDTGHIEIDGKRVSLRGPKDALNLGIGMVHQHFSLIPTLTVKENFQLLTNKKVDEKEIVELSKRLNLSVNPNAKVSSLSAGERQRLEVLRLLYFNFRIMIFDEPTSVLTPLETDNLLKEIRKMAEEGRTIFFISHKLNEVMAVSDRITVLRRGRVTWTGRASETTMEDLIKHMVERLPAIETKDYQAGREQVLTVSDLKVRSEKGHLAVNMKRNSIEVYKGEVVGIAGIAGNGQLELFDAIFGLRKTEGGKVLFKGIDVTHLPVYKRIALGMGYIPEDRILTGLAPDLSVKENLIMKLIDSPRIKSMGIFLDERRINEYAEELIREFDIKTPSPDTPVKTLSGGNLQKVILAREISMKPDLLLAYEPTKGLDIAATYFIRNKLIEYAKSGGSVLVFSEDLDELQNISDRMYVIYNGDIVAMFRRSEFDAYKIGKAMSGIVLAEVS